MHRMNGVLFYFFVLSLIDGYSYASLIQTEMKMEA